MATTSVKRKKFSLSTLVSLILTVLPMIMDSLNNPNSGDTVQVLVNGDPATGDISAHLTEAPKVAPSSSKNQTIKSTSALMSKAK